MDLRQYYLDNVVETEYYYRFYKLIRDVNSQSTSLFQIKNASDYKFLVNSSLDVIDRFKSLCLPENEGQSDEHECWFFLTLFYLYKNGYIIEEFPRLIDHPPSRSMDFSNREIRSYLTTHHKAQGGRVPHKARRELVASLTITQKDSSIGLNQSIEDKFRAISTRQASFLEMSTDEKLREIVNVIENLLKIDNKYQSLDYSQICFNYITDDMIREYKKQLQCFRHSTEAALKEREAFSKEQKHFMIDFGVTILNAIHTLTKKGL